LFDTLPELNTGQRNYIGFEIIVGVFEKQKIKFAVLVVQFQKGGTLMKVDDELVFFFALDV